MIQRITLFVALAVIGTTLTYADSPVPPGHSTVSVVFISSHSPQAMGSQFNGTTSMAHVGNVITPTETIRPIRITIDGDFVGHAMTGVYDVKPVFILPEGKRKFTFSIEGSEPVTSEIAVLGTGSKQFLIITLPADKKSAKSAAASVLDASTRQPFDN